MKSIPSQGLDLKEGVYRTPMDLLEAVNRRWKLGFDLAAQASNDAIFRLTGERGNYYSPGDDALSVPWTRNGEKEIILRPESNYWCWLNPPYDDIGAWTNKAYTESKHGAKVIILLPSATGAKWLAPCREAAQIVFLVGRPTFEFINPMSHKNADKRGKPNTDPYGKDLLLAVFGEGTGVSWWDWRK